MKLVWSPELAAKAYMDTVKSSELYQGSSVAELISAMAAGWNAKVIVETWSKGGVIATSIGLAIASTYTCGRHLCIVPDEESKSEYAAAMDHAGVLSEVVVGEPEEAVNGLIIDFLVVDCRRNDFARILKAAKLGHRGAVLVCKNANSRDATEFRWRTVFEGGSRRLVRSVFLPVGKGLDIAHVAAGDKDGSDLQKGKRRWIKRVDRQSGEEFVIRK